MQVIGGKKVKGRVLVLWTIGTIFFGWQMSGLLSAEQPMDVKEFVRRIFIEGVPYEEARKYGPTDVPTLLKMLADPKEEAYRTNIVVTLGIIGDERAVDPLIAFLGQDVKGTLSHSEYTAKSSVLMALGYLINKSGSKKALTYLRDSSDPAVWAKRKVNWASPYHASMDDRNVQLSTMAILGLALSGHPSAAEALRSLQKPPRTKAAEKFQAQVSQVVTEALKAHEMIAKQGLAEYYRKQGLEMRKGG